MTKEEKERVIKLRKRGLGARKISQATGISENTVKSFIKRSGIEPEKIPENCCPVCGKPLVMTKGKREKKFCSDACRSNWWNHHPAVKQGAKRQYECLMCGEKFFSYAARKYCSHECYIRDRFGGRYEAEGC